MWKITGLTSTGGLALRDDGEMVFIYKRPNWGEGRCGLRAFYELRSHGALIGRITAENSRCPQIRADWLAEQDRPLSEIDLMEIAASIKF